ncbi:P-loop containing nucleoside triphosphate hydrolase protein [Obba rivulosa]|uniref:P-loop containing nucleoside triphosphate hydrolase protein n=1 Tax=Obba rivulosa TaxID=1052685 RepID=A0A8E2DNI9_9APHY|nr:P-loop containing nucleoside triphosphate hydrolase protein [Obba rivulosa]
MQSTRVTRSSVLGKRPHQAAPEPSTPSSSRCEFTQTQNIPTPDSTPNPKRARTSTSGTDDGSNKENVPPFKGEVLGSPATRTRTLRRTSTGSATPSRTRNMPRRSASAIDLALSPYNPATVPLLAIPPSSPPSALPIHARARALLRPICNSVSNIAGRGEERELIREFIVSFLSQAPSCDDHPTLYVSGSPGTGKTALVNTVLRFLEAELKSHDATVVSVNCMALNGVDAIWDRLAEEFNSGSRVSKKGRKKARETSAQLVEMSLAQSSRKCILVLDELDHVASSSQALASLFALSQTFSSHIRVIGIANTHTLTSSSSAAISVQSLASVQTVHFAPYTPQQLLDILNARLAPLSEGEGQDVIEKVKKFLPTPTLTLLTKKVASQTGDVRAVFEVLRGAIDLAVASTSSDSLSTAPAVAPCHVLSALKAYAPAGSNSCAISMSSLPTPASTPVKRQAGDSETVTKVRELGLHSRLVLLAMLLACRRISAGLTLSGAPSPSPSPPRTPTKRTSSSNALSSPSKSASLETSQLHAYYSTILTRGENCLFTLVSRSEFSDLTGMLETVGLVTLSSGVGSLPGTPSKSGRRGFGRSTSFNAGGSKGNQEISFVEGVRLDEIARGLGISDSGAQDVVADVREEEVRAIWERERVRISREAKAQATAVDPGLVFNGATQG